MERIVSDLGVDVAVEKYDPTDVIVAPAHRIVFSSDLPRTAAGISNYFPEERRVYEFFSVMLNPPPSFFLAYRNSTFKDLLDAYFQDETLKSLLSFPVLGNGGLPPSLASAFVGSKVFTETLIDGGYSPPAGMQTLAEAFAENFKKAGGQLLLDEGAEEIFCEGGRATGVRTRTHALMARTVVSCCDARTTFQNLTDCGNLGFQEKVRAFSPSSSLFVLYLGVAAYPASWPRERINCWILKTYDIEGIYRRLREGIVSIENYMVHFNPDRRTLTAYLPCAFINRDFWAAAKEKLTEQFITAVERDIAAGLRDVIVCKEAASPATLVRYTSNSMGAAYGWEGTVGQFLDPDFKRPPIAELYLAGHWATVGTGIPGAAYSAFETAKLVGKKLRGKN
jgi:phytoene dehydrogenase-like protein